MFDKSFAVEGAPLTANPSMKEVTVIPATIIRKSAKIFPHNVAVSFEGRLQTYAELYERGSQVANVLRSVGAQSGDRVAVLTDNAFETLEQAAGCALGNYPRATLYTYHSPEINRYLVEHIGAKVLLVQSAYYEALAPLLHDLPDLTVLVFDGPNGSALSYEDAVSHASTEDVMVPIADSDIHTIRFSSGTTGKPKGIYHSVGRWNGFNNEWRWVTPMLDETSRYLVPCALAHLGIAFMWGVLGVGGTIIPMSHFDARQALDLMESERATHMVAVPIMIREMLADPTSDSRDLSALQCLMYSGSPIARSTLERAIQVFGPVLYQLYAQSEAMPVSMLLPHQHVVDGDEKELARLKSSGRATPNVLLSIRDEAGNQLPVGEIGEIAAIGPGTMTGIWGDPDATAARTLADGSVLTRDMGYLDDEGFLFLVDRKDDMIVSGGYNIWPTELEESLATHPAVLEASVFGIPDEKWGETPHAVVVLKDGETVDEAGLVAFSRSAVGPVKKITSVEFADSLPRTGSGKVMRSALRAPFWKDGARIAGS